MSFNSTENGFFKSVFANQKIHFNLIESDRKINSPFEKLLSQHVFGAIFVPRCTFVVPESKSRVQSTVQVQVYTSVTYACIGAGFSNILTN